MSNRPSFLGRLTKFVVVPAALAATGFYVVAPRIGGQLAETKKSVAPKDDLVARAPQAPREMHTMSGPPSTGSTELRNSGPEVDVNVHRTMTGPSVEIGTTASDPPKPAPRRRRHKKKAETRATETAPAKPAETVAPKPADPAPSISVPPTDPPPVDQGGSGGAATAGGGGSSGGSTGTTGGGTTGVGNG